MSPRKMQTLAAIVGTNISNRRKAIGLTQAAMAEQLDMGGDSLSRIEKGLVAPRFQRLANIATILDCPVADLFRTSSEPLSVKLDTLADMLRPLSAGTQEDLVCLMINMVQTFNKLNKSVDN